MMSYIPAIYPDELVYSWFCRYYIHTGCLTHKMALDEILYKRHNNLSKEFLGHLNPNTLNQISMVYPINQLITEHTMFPQYAKFISLEDKKKALYHMQFDFRDTHHLFSILPRNEFERFLKYCPLCAKEDREKHGEAYWHRIHQIRNMQICPKHDCMLIDSAVPAKSEQTFTFCPAEQYINNNKIKISNNAELIGYSQYMADVFNSSIDFDNDYPINVILFNALIKTKYISKNGNVRKTQQLTNDIYSFYSNIGLYDIASIYQIQRVLLADRFDFSVICQLAYFLGISIMDLTKPNITDIQIENERKTHYNKGKAPINWQEMDIKLAPKLEILANDIYFGTDNIRPERVSEKLIYRELNLSAHRLENLPKCKAILERYSESYAENWARRIVWAYEKFEKDGKPFYWSDIRRISGVKKKNINAVLPFLEKHCDAKLEKAIINLINI